MIANRSLSLLVVALAAASLGLGGCGPGADDFVPRARASASTGSTTSACDAGPAGVFLPTEHERYAVNTGYIRTTFDDDADPVLVHTDIYVPRNQGPGPFPVLIIQAGGGGSKNSESVKRTARLFVEQGYIAVSFTPRGMVRTDGGYSCSTGEIELVDPDKEGEDVVQVLLWIARNAASELGVETKKLPGTSTMMVGMTGGSYGGLQAWIAALMKQPQQAGPSDLFRILAIVPAATGVNMLRVAGVEMSPRRYPLSTVVQNCILKDSLGGAAVADWYAKLDANDLSAQADLIAEATRRSVALAGVQPPADLGVLIIHPWADGVFPADESIGYFRTISAGFAAKDRKLVLADAGHPSGYATWASEDVAHQTFHYEESYAYRVMREFFACHLRSGAACANPTYFAKPVSYAVPGAPTVHYELDALPDSSLAHYLTASGSLATDEPTEASASAQLRNVWPIGEPPGSLSNRKSPVEKKLVFTSQPLIDSTRLLGSGKATLYLRSDAAQFALSVRLYEVDGSSEKLITRGTYFFDGLAAPGLVRQVEIPLDAMAHVFEAGRRLRVKISNIDRFTDSGTNLLIALGWHGCTSAKIKGGLGSVSLWTLPSYVDSTQQLYMDASHRSRIDLPLFPSLP